MKKQPVLTFGELAEQDPVNAKDIEDAMRNVIKAVNETGKAGSITVTLKFSHDKNRAGDFLEVTPVIKKNVPALASKKMIVFSDEDSQPTLEDPRQPRLNLEEDKLTNTKISKIREEV